MPTVSSAKSGPIRFGVLGLGAIAQTAHLPVLSKMRGAEIAALCDADVAKARGIAQRFGVKTWCTDIDDLMETPGLDAVIVCSPNHAHEVHALSLLKAGMHLLVERPFALNARGAERIVVAAEKAGRIAMVANNHRFRHDAQTLDSFLRGGELGKLVAVRAGSYRRMGPTAPWRQRRQEAGGGSFLELGLPLLDLAGWLTDFPRVTRLSASMERGRGANAVEDAALVTIECQGNFTVSIDTRWNYVSDADRWWFEIVGTQGSARLSPLRITKELHGRPVDVSPSGASQRDTVTIQSYRSELAHFMAVVRGETSYEAAKDSVRVYKLLDMIYKAADDAKEIRL